MAAVFAVISIIISLAIPVSAIIFLKRVLLLNLKTVLIGAVTWIVFTQVLEKALHAIVLTQTQLSQNPILFSVYAGFSTGILEEAGRYFAFTRFLKNQRLWKDGLGYGLGHGGIESALIGLTGGLQTLLLIQLFNRGNLNLIPNLNPEIYSQIISSLNSPPVIFLAAGVERFLTFIIQIALSILVLYSIKVKKSRFFILAIIIHSLIAFIPAIFQAKLINFITAEIFIFFFALIGYFFIKRSKLLFQKVSD